MASEEELLLLQQSYNWIILLSRMDYWSRFAFTRSIKAVSFSVSLTAQHRFLWLVLCRYVDISYDCGTSYIIYQEVSYRDNCCMGEGKVPPGRSDHEI